MTSRILKRARWPRGVEAVCLGHVPDDIQGNDRSESRNVVESLRYAGIPARKEPGSYEGHSLIYVPRGYVTRARRCLGGRYR